jgi:hypothetical protein
MVLCAFETEELAQQYCEALWAADDKRVADDENLQFRVFGGRDDASWGGLRVERLQLWDAVPVVHVPQWGGRDELTNDGEQI